MPDKKPTTAPLPGQAFLNEDNEIDFHEKSGRTPVEAIESRRSVSEEARRDVDKALAKLVKAGTPFTVADVTRVSGRGRTLIYEDKDLKEKVLAARKASQAKPAKAATTAHDAREASWKERAQQAEALAKELHRTIKERDQRIADLQAAVRDPDGVLLVDRLSEKEALINRLHSKIRALEKDNRTLTTGLNGSRANVIRERKRNVQQHQAQADNVTPLHQANTD